MIFKGSLCIEGISLTVAKIEGTEVTAAIIPHTVKMTNLKSLKPGDPVNLEVDMIAKYVEKMIRGESANSVAHGGAIGERGILAVVFKNLAKQNQLQRRRTRVSAPHYPFTSIDASIPGSSSFRNSCTMGSSHLSISS